MVFFSGLACFPGSHLAKQPHKWVSQDLRALSLSGNFLLGEPHNDMEAQYIHFTGDIYGFYADFQTVVQSSWPFSHPLRT